MAHQKVYGICEDKCRVEVYPKEQTDEKDETNRSELASNVNVSISDIKDSLNDIYSSLVIIQEMFSTIKGGGSISDQQIHYLQTYYNTLRKDINETHDVS